MHSMHARALCATHLQHRVKRAIHVALLRSRSVEEVNWEGAALQSHIYSSSCVTVHKLKLGCMVDREYEVFVLQSMRYN